MVFLHILDELCIEKEYNRKCEYENKENSKTEDSRVFLCDIFFESIDLLSEDDGIRVCLCFRTFEKKCCFFVFTQRDRVTKLRLGLSESIGKILDDLIFFSYSFLCRLIKSNIIRSLDIWCR